MAWISLEECLEARENGQAKFHIVVDGLEEYVQGSAEVVGEQWYPAVVVDRGGSELSDATNTLELLGAGSEFSLDGIKDELELTAGLLFNQLSSGLVQRMGLCLLGQQDTLNSDQVVEHKISVLETRAWRTSIKIEKEILPVVDKNLLA